MRAVETIAAWRTFFGVSAAMGGRPSRPDDDDLVAVPGELALNVRRAAV